MLLRIFIFITLLLTGLMAFGQPQDVDFHLNAHLLPGKKILKVKRDFYDPYLWVLAQNNEVYRVNSLTQVIDNYTATFSAYNNLQFVDIAGRSKDTVFIATNSTNIIHFKNGKIRLIGLTDGIPDTVNSVGIAESPTYNPKKSAATLMIATSKGFRLYNSDKENIINHGDNNSSKICEATYRTEAYQDGLAGINNGDTIAYQPLTFAPGDGSAVTCFLWEGGKEFGDSINTATVIYDAMNGYDEVFSNSFWGNSRGMFQNYSNFSNNSADYPGGHYLNGINVNKITSIYGLTSFGSGNQFDYPGLIKQSLLIGTDNGFYYSSNIYTSNPDPLRKFSIFHDDELGNIVINDICVNVVSTNNPVCEDGVWLAANDGLYLVKPDYGAYLSMQQFHSISFQNQPDTLSDLKLCSGNSAKAMINTSRYKGKNLQWYKNGNELPAESADTLTIKTSGDYYAVLYDRCQGIHVESNHLKVTVINGPVFSFNYPDKIQHCDNTPDTLKTDYNPGYHYRWYTNGTLNGDTVSTFVVTQNGKYKVEVSACTNSWVPSKEVEVDLVTLPVPQVASDKPVYCAQDVAALTVNTPTDPGYTVNWYRDGTLLTADKNLTTINETTAGNYTVTVSSNISSCSQTSSALQLAFTPAPVFTFDYPDELQYCAGTPLTLKATGSAAYQYRWYKDGTLTGDATASLAITAAGKYKVEVSACAGSWVPSKAVQVDFVQLIVPVITTDKPAYCTGDNAVLSVNSSADLDETINWYKDNVLLPGNTNQTSIVSNVPGSYTVTLVNNIVNSDGTMCSQTSAARSISFEPPPAVSIEKIVNTTICDGQTISLAAHYSGGTVKWSTGETTDQVSVKTPGHYKVTVTAAAGCQTEASIDIAFLPNPVFSVNDTSICTYKKQVVRLMAPPGFSQYAWNGQTGGQTFDVSSPQTVSLTVTDANGCQATQQIRVTEQCANVYIPNTFTPNGDGINDTWVIEGLDSDPTALVKVFTRYGSLVFESKGYGTPWNGEYQDKKLPAGVYYYIITAKNGSQKLSGSLTIIY